MNLGIDTMDVDKIYLLLHVQFKWIQDTFHFLDRCPISKPMRFRNTSAPSLLSEGSVFDRFVELGSLGMFITKFYKVNIIFTVEYC